jgi:trk system potassium uptake protein TrkH
LLKSVLYRPQSLLVTTFGLLILVGTVLLRLPIAQVQPVGLVDAFFTATSAVCVTGLITVDTATAYSRFGQTVILALIQLGGLGIMTFAALAAQLLRLRISFSSQAAWQSVFFEGPARGDLRRALHRILLMTLVIEAIGTGLLYLGLRRAGPARGGLFEAVFHSVSAFCNAGFSVYSQNAAAFRDLPLMVATLMALIVVGGLGYTVLLEIVGRGWRRLRGRREGPVVWSLHSRIVLKMSTLLIFGGAAVLVFTGLTAAEESLGARVWHALFQSVTARTAGFNTVDIGALPLPSLLILIGLMFVGGSPGSCAGGIKTTSAAVWLARVRARLTGREDVTLERRRVPHDIVRRAALVLSVATLWNLAGAMILSLCAGGPAGVRLEQLIFEQISAFGTVGLSANPGTAVSLSGTFSAVGKLWIILTMFVGRLGPLTIALAVIPRPRAAYEYPIERVMIG